MGVSLMAFQIFQGILLRENRCSPPGSPVPKVTLGHITLQLDRHVVEQVHINVVEELVKHLHGLGHHGMLHLVMGMWLGFGRSLWALRKRFFNS